MYTFKNANKVKYYQQKKTKQNVSSLTLIGTAMMKSINPLLGQKVMKRFVIYHYKQNSQFVNQLKQFIIIMNELHVGIKLKRK